MQVWDAFELSHVLCHEGVSESKCRGRDPRIMGSNWGAIGDQPSSETAMFSCDSEINREGAGLI